MPKKHSVGCPNCGSRISFKKFVLLNNFSVINCDTCRTRIEISNRTGNAVVAAVSGVFSALAIVLCTYMGQRLYQSFLLGLLTGIILAIAIIAVICRFLYRYSHLYEKKFSR